MRWLPRLGSDKSVPLALETKDAATRRASTGRGFVYANQPYSPPGDNLERLVKDGYERVIWAFKAIDAIADKMSGWPIEVMEGFGDDAKSVEDDCLPLLNQYSNDIERAAKYFRYRLVSQLLLSKRGVFVEVIPSRGGGLAALNLLPPAWTRIVPDPDTFIKAFRVEPPGWEQGAYIDLPVYDPKKKAGVLWIRKPHPTDPYSSITPLESASISLDLDFYARMYNRNFLLNDGRAGQIVAIKGGLSPEDAQEIKARFQPGMGRAGQTTVIEADSISVQDTAVTPRDAQYAELRNITKDDILIALGTPESVIGNASGRTFDNADAEKENWLDVTVLPLSQVVDAGFDPLTRGGYDDDRTVRHDVSGEPVLRRRHEALVDKARADVAAGLITADEWRELAERDPIGRPGSRVLWIPGGKIAVGEEADELAAGELKPAGSPPEPDLSALGQQPGLPPEGPQTDLTGFDAELDAIVTDPNVPQALAAAAPNLRLVKGGLELESKAFNPNQPRYPQGHNLGGQFMDIGDTALWLAGKPLKDGTPASSVTDPNPGSTASPAIAPGGSGGAARFLSSPDPKVRAAAAIVSFPPGYQHPRVLGAPPAINLSNPKAIKLVSLRKGDVVQYMGSEFSVAEAKRGTNKGWISLTLVDGTGDVKSIAAPGSGTLSSVARTPHPQTVAQAKRDVTAAARAMAGGGAPGTAQAVAPAVVQQLAGHGPSTPVGVTVPLPAPGTYVNPGFPNSQFINTRVGNKVPPQGVWTQMINNQFAPGNAWVPLAATPAPRGAVAPAGGAPLPPAAPRILGRAAIPGAQGPFGIVHSGTYTATNGAVMVVHTDGTASVQPSPGSPSTLYSAQWVQAALGVPQGPGQSNAASSWTMASLTTSGRPFGVPAPQGMQGMPLPSAPAPAAPTPAPAPVAAGHAAIAAQMGPNYPALPAGYIAYAHPQGKVAYVNTNTGAIAVYGPDGKKKSSSATAAKLAAGHGSWAPTPTGPHNVPNPHPTYAGIIAGHQRAASAAPPAAATPAPVPTIQQTASAPPAPAPVVASPQPAAVAAVAPPPLPAPAPTGSAAAKTVIAAGVPQIRVAGWTATGGKQGSNPAAAMTDAAGKRWYVKSQNATVADNEVAAARLYAAAGVSVPQVHRASIAGGSFTGQKGTQGIASPIVQGTRGLVGRMGSDKALAAAVHEDFAVHAWLGNWDAMENDNTQIGTNGRPVTIDVGGSLLFRAQGGQRKLSPTVKELTSMRTGNAAGGSARAAFAGVTPNATDPNFVAGVERIAEISPAQIKALVDSSYPSLTQAERDTLAETLVKRRAHLAREAGVTLPENKPGHRMTAVAGAAQAAGQAAVGQPAASPAHGAVPPPNPVQVLGGTPASSVLTFPPGYPYPQVTGAPVATKLGAAKAIKVASLRKGDVISYNGSHHSVISIDRKTNDIVALNTAGQRVTFHGTNHPSGSVVTVARTPHPQVVAAARRQQAAGVAPTAAQAPNVVVTRTVPAVAPGPASIAAARNYGTPTSSGYAAVPGQTYAGATYAGVLVVHADGSGDIIGPTGLVAPQTDAQVQAMLDPGTQLVPVGPRILTPQSSHVVGRHGNAVGDVVDVKPDGTGTLTLANGNVSPVSVAGVDILLAPQANAANNFGYETASPAPRASTQQAMGATQAAAIAAGPQSAPAGGWGAAGQIVPGAVFTLSGPGGVTQTLTIGPRGGGKMTLSNGQTRNMSSASAQSALNRRNTQWQLVTAGPTAQVAAAAPAAGPPLTAAAQAQATVRSPYSAGQKGPFPLWRGAPGTYTAFNGDKIVVDYNGSAVMHGAGGTVVQALPPASVDLHLKGANARNFVYQPAAPQVMPTVTPVPAGVAGFAPQVGRSAVDFLNALQDTQVFVNPKTGNRMTINVNGQGTLVLGPKARGGTSGLKTPAMTVRTLQAAGWVAESGPDITVEGRLHRSAARKAARGAGQVPPGTPTKGTAPARGVWPATATGTVTSVPINMLSRGRTIRTPLPGSQGHEDWIVTEVTSSGAIWAYRPGVDDPLTITQDSVTKQWHQGRELAWPGRTVDVVDPAPIATTGVPTAGAARAYDPTLGAPTVTTGIGSAVGADWDFVSQNVPADQLKAGDVILLNGSEADGSFVVTDVRLDHKNRMAVYGYNGTAADISNQPGTEAKLFLAAAGGVPRQSRVQVTNAPGAVPEVPRPVPPVAASDIERNDISDASTQAQIASIMNQSSYSTTSPAQMARSGDDKLGHLMVLRGYNAPPDVITDAEMDAFVDDGEIELFRGMTGTSHSTDMAEEFRSGKHYSGGKGGSAFGTGQYSGYGAGSGSSSGSQVFRSYAPDALKFAQVAYANGNRGSADGVVIRMTLKADAKVGEFEMLAAAMRREAGSNPAVRAMSQMGDAGVGHYAVYKGYDVIRKSGGYMRTGYSKGNDWDGGFVIILNRSAMRVSTKNYVDDAYVRTAPAGSDPPPVGFSSMRMRMKARKGANAHAAGVDHKLNGEP